MVGLDGTLCVDDEFKVRLVLYDTLSRIIYIYYTLSSRGYCDERVQFFRESISLVNGYFCANANDLPHKQQQHSSAFVGID